LRLRVDYGREDPIGHALLAQVNKLRCSRIEAARGALDESDDDVVTDLGPRQLKDILGAGG
jgi:hypothetical protein